jgi:hypothetical protein
MPARRAFYIIMCISLMQKQISRVSIFRHQPSIDFLRKVPKYNPGQLFFRINNDLSCGSDEIDDDRREYPKNNCERQIIGTL